jgi:thioredoxin reductase (NADPH)
MKPVIMTVDDDPQVLRSVERDLRSKYGNEFRVIRADSGTTALEILKQLKLRNEAPALFLVDQRMPNMTGVEFLEQAMNIFSDAKRVLLTAYADTDAAIRSINTAKIDYYLMKPWDPPEQNLFPIVDDLLDDWMASFRPPFEGIRLISLFWSPKSHETKDFLARNGVPYQWLDAESDQEARRLVDYIRSKDNNANGAIRLPILVFQYGGLLCFLDGFFVFISAKYFNSILIWIIYSVGIAAFLVITGQELWFQFNGWRPKCSVHKIRFWGHEKCPQPHPTST